MEPWKTPDCYPQGRAAEFAIAAMPLAEADGKNIDAVLIYVTECEHQDGDSYWNQFPTLTDAIEDFKIFLVNADL
jgi:hypothetical protein